MNVETLGDLLGYVRQNGRVCPNPQLWNELWSKLPGKKQMGSGWMPPAPLILAAWHMTSDDEKASRLAEHIQYAHQHGFLDEVDRFLRSLAEDLWVHRGDI